jgi:hypothetical protein
MLSPQHPKAPLSLERDLNHVAIEEFEHAARPAMKKDDLVHVPPFILDRPAKSEQA